VIGDLDLRTGWGVRELRNRISFTATTLCNRLNAMYPVSADGTNDRDCYRNAMRDAMAQAHDAIRAARGDGEY
jgi:UrcA family protein